MGYLETLDHVGSGPETYFVVPGISADEYPILGDYRAYVVYWSGDLPIRWRMAATLHDEELWFVEGELTEGDEESDVYIATVEDYEEPDCPTPPPAATPAPVEGML